MAFYTFLKRPKPYEGAVPEPIGQISMAKKKPVSVKQKTKPKKAKQGS